MCSRMDPDIYSHSHIQTGPTHSQSLTARNHDQDPVCSNFSIESDIHAEENATSLKEDMVALSFLEMIK